MPYGGGADTRIINGSETVLASERGWNTNAVSETITLADIDFSGNNVATISGLSDVNRLIVGIQFKNDSAGIDSNGGIDNVSLLVAVPEPSAFGLIAGLLGLSFAMIRRRK